MRWTQTLLISALVAASALAQDVPKPRVLIIATASEGMDEQRDDEAQALIEEVFQEMEFETIDATQLASIKDIDDALNSPDAESREKILALRTRYGAEVIVAVKYDKQFATGGSRPNAMWWYLFNGKCIRTDTASQIASKSYKSERPRNSFNHFVPTAQEFANLMASKVLTAWAKEATQGLRMQLFVSKGDAVNFAMLQQNLQNLPTVDSCNQRSFQRDTCEYEVMYNGTKEQFVVELSSLTGPSLLVTGYEANRVDAEITDAAPPPPQDTTAPVVTITSPLEGALFNSSRVTVTGTVDDPSIRNVRVGGSNVNVNGGSFSAVVSCVEGANSVEASATDAAGNRGSDRVSFTVDTVGPEVSIIAPQNGRNLTQVEINVGVRATADDLNRVEVNGVLAELFRAPDTYKATITLAEGNDIEIRAVAYDHAGNTGVDRIFVNVDTTPPELDGKVTVIVSGQVDDPSHKVFVNGKAVQVRPDGSWETTVELTETKLVEIVAEDEFGNRTVKVLDYSK